ncbi:hypothetical protein [Methyloglobulus sp.]|uniref:hypothetical protein n=1 Tax=Methyloglobulus sp. TaxID=2518622 RepID=UPI00398991C7
MNGVELAVFVFEVFIAVVAGCLALIELVRYLRENAVGTKLTELFPGASRFILSKLAPKEHEEHEEAYSYSQSRYIHRYQLIHIRHNINCWFFYICIEMRNTRSHA